jgi:hypothetical protein
VTNLDAEAARRAALDLASQPAPPRTTYDLLSQIRMLVASLEASGGEANSETEDALVSLAALAENKAETLLYADERLAIEEEAEVAAERRHAARRRAIGTSRDRVRGLLRELVQCHLDLTGESKIRTAHGTVYLSQRLTVEGPEDPAAWPAQYVERRESIHVDRRAAERDLKAGQTVEGLRLIDSVSVGVRR